MENKKRFSVLCVILIFLISASRSVQAAEPYKGYALMQSTVPEKRTNKLLLFGGIGLIGLGGAFLLAGYNDDGSFGKPDPSLVGLGWGLTGGGLLCVAFSF